MVYSDSVWSASCHVRVLVSVQKTTDQRNRHCQGDDLFEDVISIDGRYFVVGQDIEMNTGSVAPLSSTLL